MMCHMFKSLFSTAVAVSVSCCPTLESIPPYLAFQTSEGEGGGEKSKIIYTILKEAVIDLQGVSTLTYSIGFSYLLNR